MGSGRWEGDERGSGVADAGPFVAGAMELVEAMQERGWVTEDPEVHLLHHLHRACEALPFELVGAEAAQDGALEVELRWTGRRDAVGAAREAVFALVGSIAENVSYVRHLRRPGEPLRADVVTGMLAGESPFAPHGHTLRLTVAGIS
jgi:hypothetical protein